MPEYDTLLELQHSLVASRYVCWKTIDWKFSLNTLYVFGQELAIFATNCVYVLWGFHLKKIIWVGGRGGAFITTTTIIISAVRATAGRWPPQLMPCTSILGHPHPLTATNFLDVVSPSLFGSPSYSFSFSGCPF